MKIQNEFSKYAEQYGNYNIIQERYWISVVVRGLFSVRLIGR